MIACMIRPGQCGAGRETVQELGAELTCLGVQRQTLRWKSTVKTYDAEMKDMKGPAEWQLLNLMGW